VSKTCKLIVVLQGNAGWRLRQQ